MTRIVETLRAYVPVLAGLLLLAAAFATGRGFAPHGSPLPLLEEPVYAQFGNSANVRLMAPYRVTVGASAVQLTTSGNVRGVILKAIAPGQTVDLGTSSAVTTSNGYPMVDGETLTLEIRDAAQVYAVASAANQAVVVFPFVRY